MSGSSPDPAGPRRLRTAVIGCGHLGTFHARLARGLPQADLVMVVDIIPERARALAEELGVPWSPDREAAIEAAEALTIATPTTTHFEVASSVLRAGRAALVEKPLASSAEQGRALTALARKHEALLAVGHVERFNPAFRAARAWIGAPRFIESHRLSTFVERSLDVDVVLDLMIHDLDLTLGLVRAPIEAIDAIGVPVLTGEEDIANARIRFVDGAVANLTASRVSRERVRKIRFFGERRYVSVDLMERKVEQVLLEEIGEGPATSSASIPAALAAAGAARAASSTATQEELALLAFLEARRLRLRHGPIEVPQANALEEELRDFLRAAAGDGALEGASGEDGLRSLEAALAIRGHVKESLRRLAAGGARTGP
jgi:predicted dehydrogenase